ncbi:MAG: hypothetical protein U1F66_10810 [bacterium]
MTTEAADLIPIPYSGVQGPPELADEASLLMAMATEPLTPSEARAYARKKYLSYFLILFFCLGLPVSVWMAVQLGEWGFPPAVSRAGVWISLLFFFAVFLAMLALMVSRGKAVRHLGLHPVPHAGTGEGALREGQDYVAMQGERRGRRWEYGVRDRENFWRYRGALPSFQIAFRDGAFCASPQLPSRLRALLGSIPPRRSWRRLRLSAGAEGLSTARPLPLAKYFIQDLWLAEKILDALGIAPSAS